MTNRYKLQHIRHTGEYPEGHARRYPDRTTGCRIKSGMTKPNRLLIPVSAPWKIIFLLALILLMGSAPTALCKSTADAEEQAVLKAARKFLDAEIRRDYPAVYACFAPSSAYLRTHNYQQYLAEAKAAPYYVVAYQIVRVNYIQDNRDPQTISTADKIAQVEVEVTFAYEGAKRRSVSNIGFIFLKEGGKWYKS